MSQALAVRSEPHEYAGLTATVSPTEAALRFQELQAFVQSNLVLDVDYGVIPGTKKPSLWQSGAQKIAELYGFASSFVDIATIGDWDRGLFVYRKKCILTSRRDGRFIGDGVGSCNSKEDKYGWRWVSAQQVKAMGLDPQTLKRKENKWGTTFRVPNEDVFSIVNTIEKMACKRALIHAVIGATRASGLFTQDVEDLPSELFGRPESARSWAKDAMVYDSETGEVLNARPALPVPSPTPRDAWSDGPPRDADADADAIRAELLALAPKLASDKARAWLDEKLSACRGNAPALEALLEHVEAKLAERATATQAGEPPAPEPTKEPPFAQPEAVPVTREWLERQIDAATTEQEAKAPDVEAQRALAAGTLHKIDAGAIRSASKRKVVELREAAKASDAESAALRDAFVARIAAAIDNAAVNRVVIESAERFEAGVLSKADVAAVKAKAEEQREQIRRAKHFERDALEGQLWISSWLFWLASAPSFATGLR